MSHTRCMPGAAAVPTPARSLARSSSGSARARVNDRSSCCRAQGLTASGWDVVASGLARDRTVCAVDLRGHGQSDWPGTYSIELMADDVLALLPQLGADVDLVVTLPGRAGCVPGRSRIVGRPCSCPRGRRAASGAAAVRAAPPPGDVPFDWVMVEQVHPRSTLRPPTGRTSSPDSHCGAGGRRWTERLRPTESMTSSWPRCLPGPR